VEVISGTSTNALLVPLEALRDLGNGVYGVFVLNAQGQPRLRLVQVGLQDTTRAEIKSGVQLGDVVTTGTTNTR
jgi:HlyD family secretion protein